ncbi:hypothetical protein PYW08_004461 [Mythimna loreyi]|uniref:Uncharacterized protein n=1 Tax=Mythimna loreyi TaxID=667449 RepID=A0ACC2QR72_9NEOP|nr:hypothetical protein PYW08_004461 [Mythimna loreyi]
MELLSQDEINLIVKKCGFTNVLSWKLEDFPDKVIGYLGDHMKLIIQVELHGISSSLNLFLKCMPRFDKWKSEYLKELGFFNKEYVMLSGLFNEFENGTGSRKWRPKLLFIREDIFVFENVSLLGYVMPHHQETMGFEELKASVECLARFHAQSYIYEERKSKQLGRPYRIWEHYSDYLQEPNSRPTWRNTGRNAVIDYLKEFSKYKSEPNFNRYVESVIPKLFQNAMDLMKPSSEYRNAVVHRDLWTNNIFLKKENNSSYHALIIDFQTVLYTSPMLDLSSLIYFNTSRSDRDKWTEEVIEIYYESLSEELQANEIDIVNIFNKTTISEAYKKSIVFGITQAAIITPIVAMSKEKREELFCDPKLSIKVNEVSRSQEFIDIAKEDDKYQRRITELLDEIVERFVFPKNGR